MSAEEHKAAHRRACEEGVNQQDLSVMAVLTAAAVVSLRLAGTTHGLVADKQYLSAYLPLGAQHDAPIT